jgi:actin-related protein
MLKIKFPLAAALIVAWMLSMSGQAALSSKPDAATIPQPEVDLLPQDVVRIVIDALANNDEPYADAGIATTFAFASPANKVSTGPLEKFTSMVKNNVYGIMVNHSASEFSEVVLTGNNAYQMVKLTGGNGSGVVFAFRLSKQLDGQFAGMWMTDAVWPVSNVMVPEQAF